jgi:mannitol/fructose-specific phosphotransferase system IIA component (Ntr-type)
MEVVATASPADYTRLELIVPALRERDTAGVIGELSHALQRHGYVVDLLPFYHTALNQELLSSSTADRDVALPHARLAGVKRLQFALGRAPEPLAWGPRSCGRVHLVFLLAVPATDAAAYLHLLASLARLSQQEEILRELRAAPSPEAIMAILERVRVGQG